MKILIIGSGGREHALGMALAKENRKLYFAPGNGGTEEIGTNINILPTDISGLLKFAEQEGIDYTVVGPEDPLVQGIVDEFENRGMEIFGPRKEGALLEGSKEFAKEFCIRHKIPTAKYFVSSNRDDGRDRALEFLKEDGIVVLKADGLCAGKGVTIAKSEEDIEIFLREMFDENKYGKKRLLVEKFLPGFEVSYLCFTDGHVIRPLASSRDHKKIFEGERGPNTGGMGTYSPNDGADIYRDEVEEKILNPFLKGLQEDEIDFRGLIFIGCMITKEGISVLEFNTRFGDPETQSVLHRLDTDLLEVMMGTSRGQLKNIEVKENNHKVVSVVLASKGYPGEYEKDKIITGLDSVKDVFVYHAGTMKKGNHILTNGGRVLCITAIGKTFSEAYKKAYREVKKIYFEGMVYRQDIGPLVQRVYVKKKKEFDQEGPLIKKELTESLSFPIEEVEIYHRYDIEHLPKELLEEVITKVLSEPPVDEAYSGKEAFLLEKNLDHPIVIEYLPGQFDQREQGMIDTIAVTTGLETLGKVAKVLNIKGDISIEDLIKIKDYFINPVDQQEGQLLGIPTTLKKSYKKNMKNPIYQGFCQWSKDELKDFLKEYGLAMSFEDIEMVQSYYKTIGRDPNEVELAVLDTYWSDHCRHTTFNTEIQVEEFSDKSLLDQRIKKAYKEYENLHDKISSHKNQSFMDLGTIVAKELREKGKLDDVEVSDEINACSVEVSARIQNPKTKVEKNIPYLFMFKNETHNHPTEVEPFGGASTCLGGAIRDPLSGRSYVYQAMRVTGAANPFKTKTMEGKLPQKKIIQEAMKGYSSYGNQIGLATGLTEELYHPGYVAKRMEVGAVLGAAPKSHVIRKKPEKGDVILLIGGRTGRDGVGGATGSSQAHNMTSIVESSAEVQKGNAPMERKLQRLFRKKEVASKIKKCNDFGAGGVAVAIGELADSLIIYLDRVPLKYMGLSPKEIAISESQERMAVVIDKKDLDFFIEECKKENLEVTNVSTVTDTGYMEMKIGEETVLKLSREFLDSAGASRSQRIKVLSEDVPCSLTEDRDEDLKTVLTEKYPSQKNMSQQFDSTIGRGTVLAPYGGRNQSTPVRGMVAALPSLEGESQTVSIMTYGFDPTLSEESQFLGGYYAVVESLCNFAALGGNPLKARLSFQEYFQSLGEDEETWSKPLKSLLGAFTITRELGVPPIGGKDSMSGTFHEYHVPPTLISFAAGVTDIENIISPEFKGKGKIGIIETKLLEDGTLDIEELKKNFTLIQRENNGNILALSAINHYGLLPTAFLMALGNDLDFTINSKNTTGTRYGSFLVEYQYPVKGIQEIGNFSNKTIINNVEIPRKEIEKEHLGKLDSIFAPELKSKPKIRTGKVQSRYRPCKKPVQVPKVLIPTFPGTNCEWDTLEAFEREGAKGEILVFRNNTIDEIKESMDQLAKAISESQILVLPGGFSLGDEPDGSAKFIANVLRNKKVAKAIEILLTENDGLILGICNGFQGLIKSGLLPYGKVMDLKEDSPTLTYNNSGRHIARFISTKIQTLDSPWLSQGDLDQSYILPISNGEGRFICNEEVYRELLAKDQIATIYEETPNGSYYGIEGLLSPDGKILGKMGHTERVLENRCINIPNQVIQPIIASGVAYMKGKKND
ncbi:MAG: phosphoribosylformylglycinamidine synthase [Tissierellia bacterium]|nr:phosphoribosylformylglycinamidine synthase [Tissierellia bacterium]